MTPVQISRDRFSEVFWNIVDEKVDEVPWDKLEEMIKSRQRYRLTADYNTGSVSIGDAAELYRLVKFFKPEVIAEVGTFIGVSTMSMYMADEFFRIYTCDMSNDLISLFEDADEVIKYFPKTTSTQMFKQMAETNLGIDLMYLDGRLQREDLELFHKIIHDQTIFVFDGFVGIEKGVVNAMMVESPGRVLIYPREGKKTAVSLPFTMLQFVPQEAT
jgi:predicted O-methyltransferase YrrM